MKIKICGAARTVTGSQYIVEVNHKQMLLECGLYQGKRDESYERNQQFPFEVGDIEAVVLSHAHLDHCGNLPNLVKKGFKGAIYATQATIDLAEVVIKDSGHIHEQDVRYLNKRRAKKGLPAVEPLYTQLDAEAVLPLFVKKAYNERFSPMEGVTVTLVDAGHILGSAAIILDLEENGIKRRLWFSGDVGRTDMPLLRNPVLPYDADYLLMECTYGDKAHDNIQNAFDEFGEVIKRTVKRGGKVIVPAFSIGRTQLLVYALNELIARRQIPRIPVVVDSPMAVTASDIYKRHHECFDEETWQFISDYGHPALDFKGLFYTRSVQDSKDLNDRKEPMVIISASGMAESGRILHHLANNIEDKRNTIVIVSWQSPDTLGRRLAEKQEKIRIFGEEYTRRAEVATIGGLSAHAGQKTLVDYALACRARLKKTILIHGESDQAGALMQKLKEAGSTGVSYPQIGEVIEIT